MFFGSLLPQLTNYLKHTHSKIIYEENVTVGDYVSGTLDLFLIPSSIVRGGREFIKDTNDPLLHLGFYFLEGVRFVAYKMYIIDPLVDLVSKYVT
jgi:hypothetical protein